MSDTLERRMYATSRHGSVEFHIAVIGAKGAVEFHFMTLGKKYQDVHATFPLLSLGVEAHRRVPAEDSNRPSCHLLNGSPCKHDGVSTYGSEYVMPAFMQGGSDSVYPILERCYGDWFVDEQEAANA